MYQRSSATLLNTCDSVEYNVEDHDAQERFFGSLSDF